MGRQKAGAVLLGSGWGQGKGAKHQGSWWNLSPKDDSWKEDPRDGGGGYAAKTFSRSPDPSLDPTSSAVENLAAEILPAELRYPVVTRSSGPTLPAQLRCRAPRPRHS